ncbi:hypothetical protein RUM44_002181 [Polyplax serrata]|uniref:Uncharacterized protein n=1 Tax=Polyplax serrata TaxID=468196 RepID=A0ABR1AM64_POLSC
MRERQEKKVAFSNLTKRPDLTDGNPKFEIAKQRKIVENGNKATRTKTERELQTGKKRFTVTHPTHKGMFYVRSKAQVAVHREVKVLCMPLTVRKPLESNKEVT